MSNIDKRATELLIENGMLVADTLRHLADNEIDSDYFAICHSNENGTEIECELAITDYARQAAGTVDELVKALEAAEKRIAELEARDKPKFVQCWSCKHDIEVLAIADCDGYCPRCAAPIDLDDEPYAAAGKGEAS